MSGLGECIYRDGLEEGLEEGMEKGRLSARIEAVLELLEEYGCVPDDLREKIIGSEDLEQLRRWHMLAARSASIEEFRKRAF